MALLTLIALAIVIWLLASPILVIALWRRVSRLEERLARFAAESSSRAREAAGQPPTESRAEESEPSIAPPTRAEPPIAPEPAPESSAGAPSDFETRLASRWMVWVGGVALALGAVFLVKYSIDQGWLVPAVRVLAGLALGVALSAAGERLRRHPLLRPLAALRPEYIPAAVAGGGLVALFASIYAAHAYYGFVGTVPAFAALAAVAIGAIAMALLHGRGFALFGMLAGFAIPALIGSPEPDPSTVFPYFALLTGVSLVLVRYRGWWWLGWIAVGVALAWAVFWVVTVRTDLDGPVVGGYLIVVGGLATLARRGLIPEPGEADDLVGWASELFRREPFVVGSLAAIAAAMLAVVVTADFATPALIAAIALVGAMLWVARSLPSTEASAIVAATLTVVLLATWRAQLPSASSIAAELAAMARPPGLAPLIPPSLEPFTAASAAFVALFGIGGFVALWRARVPAYWATLSVAVPLALVAFTYVTARDFESDLSWSAVAVVLALAFLVAAERTGRSVAPGMTGALGAYAIGVCGALGFAVAVWLRQAWLTVTLAAMLPALGWVHGRLKLEPLRWVAWIVGGIVLTRLLANPNVIAYALGPRPAIGWVLYGYGLPLAFFLIAARLFGGRAGDPLVVLLQAGAAAFAVALQVLETRLLLAGSLTAPMGLAERSVHSLAWLAASLWLFHAHRVHASPVLPWAGRLLLGAAIVHIGVGHLIVDNPLFVPVPVHGWPIVNVLALAYLAPAVLLGVHAVAARARADPTVERAAAYGAFLLTFAYLSLEVRHVFQGTLLDRPTVSDAELYAYSVVWLLFGAALLAAALVTRRVELRYGSLVVIVLVVAKAFLWDMAGMTGMYRALSFLGLGAALVGVGLVYQRFVFRRDPA